MHAQPTPLLVAAAVNRTKYREREAQLREQLSRRVNARSRGYNGPLTRAELAASVKGN